MNSFDMYVVFEIFDFFDEEHKIKAKIDFYIFLVKIDTIDEISGTSNIYLVHWIQRLIQNLQIRIFAIF